MPVAGLRRLPVCFTPSPAVKRFDLTLPTPAENLACDEALLCQCEETGGDEILRFWEPVQPFVVVGYANAVASEVNAAACQSAWIFSRWAAAFVRQKISRQGAPE